MHHSPSEVSQRHPFLTIRKYSRSRIILKALFSAAQYIEDAFQNGGLLGGFLRCWRLLSFRRLLGRFAFEQSQNISQCSCGILQAWDELLLLEFRNCPQIRSETWLAERPGNERRQNNLSGVVGQCDIQQASGAGRADLFAEGFREDCRNFHVQCFADEISCSCGSEISCAKLKPQSVCLSNPVLNQDVSSCSNDLRVLLVRKA